MPTTRKDPPSLSARPLAYRARFIRTHPLPPGCFCGLQKARVQRGWVRQPKYVQAFFSNIAWNVASETGFSRAVYKNFKRPFSSTGTVLLG